MSTYMCNLFQLRLKLLLFNLLMRLLYLKEKKLYGLWKGVYGTVCGLNAKGQLGFAFGTYCSLEVVFSSGFLIQLRREMVLFVTLTHYLI